MPCSRNTRGKYMEYVLCSEDYNQLFYLLTFARRKKSLVHCDPCMCKYILILLMTYIPLKLSSLEKVL